MECPICLGRGIDRTPKNYGGLVVECRRCGTYRIMQRAAAVLRRLPVDQRLEALRQARRVASNAWPTISALSL